MEAAVLAIRKHFNALTGCYSSSQPPKIENVGRIPEPEVKTSI